MHRLLLAGIFACTSSLALMAATEPGIMWETKNREATRMDLNDVASNGSGRLIAVGPHGTIRASDDHGLTWTTKDSNVSFELEDITWTGSQWLAVGGFFRSACLALKSTDGESWTSVALGDRPVLHGVASSPTASVTVGDLGLAVRSSDLTAWSGATDGTRSLYDVVWDGSQYVAVGYHGQIKTSPDGTNWTARTSGLTTDMALYAVAWNGFTLVAAGVDQSTHKPLILTSTDGVAWAAPSMAAFPNFTIEAIAWTGSRFVAMGTSGHTLTSADGAAWSHHQVSGSISILGLCWDGSRLVAVGKGGGILTTTSATPTESSDWEVSSSPNYPDHFFDMATGDVSSVARTVVVGGDGTIVTSDNEFDSITPQTSGTNRSLYGVCATSLSSKRFIAVGTLGTILTSPDAVTWTQRTSGTTKTLRSAAWFNSTGPASSRAITVGDDGTILTSENTTTWTSRTSGTTEDLQSVAVGTILVGKPPLATQRVVAVGTNGTILYSTEGTAWIAASTPATSAHLFCVAALDYGFIAVGGTGVILTSKDGSTWTTQPSGTVYYLYGVTWTGSQAVVAGKGGVILSSPTGSTWTRRYAPGSMTTNTVGTLDSGRLAAAGNDGIIAISDPSVDFSDWIAGESPPPGEHDPEDDPNGDGITNLAAYALGIPAVDPSTPEDLDSLLRFVQLGSSRRVILRMRAAGAPLGDITYILEESSTLQPGSWSELLRSAPGQTFGTGSIDIILPAGERDIFLVFPETLGDRAHYFTRLRVDKSP